MITTKNRKEITLDTQTLSILQIQAEMQGRKLKNYMEQVLKEQANNFELTEEYKNLIDNKLEKLNNDQLNFITEVEFRKRTARK